MSISATDARRAGVVTLTEAASAPVEERALDRDRQVDDARQSDRLTVSEETFDVSKRQVTAGVTKVSTHTETIEQIAEASLEHRRVEVKHVPVGRVVDTAPDIRTEGDLTIVPVLEERVVIVKQLFLVEEVHIRRRVEVETQQIPVQLRRQTATIEHVDAAEDGRAPPDTLG